ncbi:hypothetical protein KY312_02925 [Candidatus Woesearchaeota archaeon]|nr:hypothetical protein [Candidatus Woesearchaeota archaeon]
MADKTKVKVQIDSCANLEQPPLDKVLEDGKQYWPGDALVGWHEEKADEGSGVILYTATMDDVPEGLRKDINQTRLSEYEYDCHCKSTGHICPFVNAGRHHDWFSFEPKNESFKRCPGYEKFSHAYEALINRNDWIPFR